YVSLAYLKQIGTLCLGHGMPLDQLNPHVGDTCCEIRASWVTYFFSKKASALAAATMHELLESIDLVMQDIHSMLHEQGTEELCKKLNQIPKNTQQAVTFKDFLLHHKLFLSKYALLIFELKYLN